MVTFTDKAIEKFREFLNGENTHGIKDIYNGQRLLRAFSKCKKMDRY